MWTRSPRVLRALLLALAPVLGRLPGMPHFRAARAKVWLDAQLAELVRSVRDAPDTPGLLGAMVRGGEGSDQQLTDQELLDNLRLLLLAGHETTASVMAWMVAYLVHHEDVGQLRLHPPVGFLERWTSLQRNPTPLELMQFGGGSHFCLGYPLAWLEAVQFVTALSQTMTTTGRRLVSRGFPRPRFFPLLHPRRADTRYRVE
ncbi:MAG: cytochrome P450 [Myxococcales bacterium]|nr:cytochrome P450 [Myxococcales bacterium]